MLGRSALVLIAAMAALTGSARAAEMSVAVAAERAALAAQYMVSAERADGGFNYEYDFLTGTLSSDDNIVRQAGAGFALAEYLAQTGDAGVRARIEGALDYYARQSAPAGHGRIVSSTGLWVDGRTGATALALLTELYYFKATGDTRFAQLRADWLRALSDLQLPDGDFARGPGTRQTSPFYNGETWLALALAAQLFPDDERLADVLKAADRFMIDTYGPEPVAGFTHWGLMAAALRFETTGEARFADFLVQVSEILITKQRPSVRPSGNACSLVEGMAAAARVLHQADYAPDLVRRLTERSVAELANSIQMQVLPGDEAIDFGDGRRFVDPALSDVAGAFRNRRYDLKSRIDLTQHCLSGLLKYQALRAVLPE